jgi:hypothetical protein
MTVRFIGTLPHTSFYSDWRKKTATEGMMTATKRCCPWPKTRREYFSIPLNNVAHRQGADINERMKLDQINKHNADYRLK